MPTYHMSLWSADLGRVMSCEIGGESAVALLERFEQAGRSALRLAAAGLRGARARQAVASPR